MGNLVAPSLSVDSSEQELKQAKTVALIGLIACFGLFLLARGHAATGVWGWVGAFSEAALVGSLADWYAVSALFRHPLGLRIPHTAIIPRNKGRIADNLAAFIRDKFLHPAQIMDWLQSQRLAERLALWIKDPNHTHLLASKAATFLTQVLDTLDSERFRQILHDSVSAEIEKLDLSATTASLLGLLTRDGRHQALLDEVLTQVAQWVNRSEVKAYVSSLMLDCVKAEYPWMTTVVGVFKNPDQIARTTSDKLASALTEQLQRVLADPDHELRQKYDDATHIFIRRLQGDPALQRKVEALKYQILNHPALRVYLNGLGHQLRDGIKTDLQSDQSRIRKALQEALVGFGGRLTNDAIRTEVLNSLFVSASQALTGPVRDGIAQHIAQTVRGWGDQQIVTELELSVGKDLQYIRINGLVVGGLIGLLLFHPLITVDNVLNLTRLAWESR